MFKLIAPLLVVCALAIPAAALADDPPGTQPTAPTLLPAPAPPTTPVNDEAGASVFAKAFLIAHAGDLVPGARAVDVSVQACDQVDAVARFYCLAKARLAQIQRVTVTRFFRVVRGHDRHKTTRAADDGGGDWSDHRDNRHQRPVRVNIFRVRLFQCVAVVRIVGGPSVAPSATIPIRDCVQVGQTGTPTPTPYPTDTTY